MLFRSHCITSVLKYSFFFLIYMEFCTADSFCCFPNAFTNNHNSLCDRMLKILFTKFYPSKCNIGFNLFEIKAFILPLRIPTLPEQQKNRFVLFLKYKFIDPLSLIYLLQLTYFLFIVKQLNPKHCKFKNQDGIKICHYFIWFFLSAKSLGPLKIIDP